MMELPDAPPTVPPAGAPGPLSPLVIALGASLAKLERASNDPDAAEMVHDARKAMKEYRALLRLADGALSRAARQEASALARSLASARDQATAREALDLLETAGLLQTSDLEAARAVLGDEADVMAAAEHLRTGVQDFLEGARAALATALGEELAAADLAAGLARGYGAARRGRFDDPPSQHETRKRVVTHRYQMSFVAAYFDGRGARRAQRAQRLRDLLGAYQDIETLRPMLHGGGESLGPAVLMRLDAAMARLQKRLRRQARQLHEKLFRRPERLFARKWGARLAAVWPAAA